MRGTIWCCTPGQLFTVHLSPSNTNQHLQYMNEPLRYTPLDGPLCHTLPHESLGHTPLDASEGAGCFAVTFCNYVHTNISQATHCRGKQSYVAEPMAAVLAGIAQPPCLQHVTQQPVITLLLLPTPSRLHTYEGHQCCFRVRCGCCCACVSGQRHKEIMPEAGFAPPRRL